MLTPLVFFSILLPCCLTMRNTSSKICHKMNLCRNIESCYPVVMQCQNGSCRFSLNDTQRASFARWFYDSNLQRCRRETTRMENFVYFLFLRNCRRLCSVTAEEKIDKTIMRRAGHRTSDHNNTIYVNLQIDLTPRWIEKLTNLMNISMSMYNSQVDYFQTYRRRFTKFIDSSYQLMLDRQENIKKKNK